MFFIADIWWHMHVTVVFAAYNFCLYKRNLGRLRCEVLTTVLLIIQVFWDALSVGNMRVVHTRTWLGLTCNTHLKMTGSQTPKYTAHAPNKGQCMFAIFVVTFDDWAYQCFGMAHTDLWKVLCKLSVCFFSPPTQSVMHWFHLVECGIIWSYHIRLHVADLVSPWNHGSVAVVWWLVWGMILLCNNNNNTWHVHFPLCCWILWWGGGL
jgi:hypothetical protein